jgi:hypothetical protein
MEGNVEKGRFQGAKKLSSGLSTVSIKKIKVLKQPLKKQENGLLPNPPPLTEL